MESRAHINGLPDDLLVRVLWHSSGQPLQYKPSKRRCDWSGISLHFKLGESDALPQIDHTPLCNTIVPSPPIALADAAFNLVIASVCQRWRRVARQFVASLLLKPDLVVSLRSLTASVSSFPNLTHLHLNSNSVETLDDSFLAHLASSCPKLTAFHAGLRIAPYHYDSRKDFHPITESGLDLFFRHSSQLQQLSLYCLHRDTKLPASFFHLVHLHTLVLTNSSALEAPDLVNLSALTTLLIASPNLTREQVSRLSRLTSLTSISTAEGTAVEASAGLALMQLSSLNSLVFEGSCPPPLRLLPSDSPCSSVQELLIGNWAEQQRLPNDIGDLLPCLSELGIFSCGDSFHLPRSFSTLHRLTCLRMVSCGPLSSLPEGFGQLSALKMLSLSGLMFSDFPDCLCQLQSLEALMLRNCPEMQQLPDAFCSLPFLRTLVIEDSPLLVLPECFGELPSLETLVRSKSRQQQFPSSFTRLGSLTRLELLDCKFDALPARMDQLSSLQVLYLHRCPITELPELITAVTNLERLSVDYCSQLASVPRRLDSLGRLKWLQLTECSRLSHLPAALPCSLEILHLSASKRVNSLPDISVLPKLQKLSLNLAGTLQGAVAFNRDVPLRRRLELSLADCAEQLPFPFSFFPQLHVLVISRVTNVVQLPTNLGRDVPQLRQLRLGCAPELTDLPASITALQHLTSLSIDYAPKLAALPDNIGALSRLRVLQLKNCSALEHLPASLTQLASLNQLDIESCPIRSLPANFAQLKKLRRLYLHGCKQLQALPEGFTKLKTLQFLGVGECEHVVDGAGLERMYGLMVAVAVLSDWGQISHSVPIGI